MDFLRNLFSKKQSTGTSSTSIESKDELYEELTHHHQTYGRREEAAQAIAASGDQREIKKAANAVAKTMLKQATKRSPSPASTSEGIAECARAMLIFGQPAVKPLLNILDKIKNDQIGMFSQIVQTKCCTVLARIDDTSALPRLREYVTHIEKLPTVDMFVLSHAREAVKALEGAPLL